METKKFNSTQSTDKSKENKKNFGSYAATAAGAAAVGGVVGAMANDGSDPVEEIIDPQPVQPTPSQPEEPTVVIDEPQVVVEEPVIIEAEPITAAVTEEPISSTDAIAHEEREEQPISEEPVDPDLIADAIISGDEIDPNDIDMADVINFNDIGTVYTVDGQSYTAASFQDETGSELLMVDVDGDDIFDIVTTQDGYLLADTGGVLSVSDVEAELFSDPGHGLYLAQDNAENTDSTSGENFLDDIINA